MKAKRKPLTKIQRRAKGEPCYLMTDDCSQDPNDETVVLCHAPFHGRGGMRDHDEWAAPGCSDCHDLVDGRSGGHERMFDISEHWYIAIRRWQQKLLDEGLMEVKK